MMKGPMKRALLCLFAVVMVLGAPPARKQPKLVLAVVIDQFRYDYLIRFRKDYNAGFTRVLEHGAVFTDAHHIHFPTVTAVGHSTFMSGATPSISGIVGNEWYDRETGRSVTSVSDDNVQLVGGPGGKAGASPHRMLVSTLGDEMKMDGREPKVIGISIKDRSAILPAGHMADAAYWFDSESKSWVTSTYYMKELPEWVRQINAAGPQSKYAGAKWMPIDAKDDKAEPFCVMGGGSPQCGPIEATPWGNELIEAFAEKAIAVENMGKHSGTDILTVSFSSNDYVGHAKGPDSPEVRDISIRTDRLLGKLLDYVDAQVGAGNTLFVMTADHGVAPLPEINQARRMPGGRLSERQLFETVSAALTQRFGEGKWIVGASGPIPYLNQDLIRDKKLDEAEVERFAAEVMRAQPHVFRVYTREQLLSGQVLEDYVSRAVRNGFYRQRSGDLFFIPEAYYMFAAHGSTHGTPFNYDTHVPVIFMGPGVKPGEYHSAIAVNDIAPTLSAMLGVEEPSGSVGRVLSEIFE
jgi:predicted AlkP superfamily pyrophosphatase or phosphodiesterase